MSEITTLLQAAGAGDRQAADRAYALLYEDLQRLAHSRLRREGHHTLLDTTALVHEAYLRLVGQQRVEWKSRAHFMIPPWLVQKPEALRFALERWRALRGDWERSPSC